MTTWYNAKQSFKIFSENSHNSDTEVFVALLIWNIIYNSHKIQKLRMITHQYCQEEMKKKASTSMDLAAGHL